jgi:thymidylate synthase
MIAFWVPKYGNEAEEDGHVHGAYGPRLFGEHENAQVCRIVELLSMNSGTRRAVIQLFDRRDIARGDRYKDVPCTSTIQFLLRSNLLHMVVNMRSNDAFMGLPHDVFAFTMLQEIVARQLSVDLGHYVHLVGSLHLYNRDQKRVRHYLEEGWQSTIGFMPPMPEGSQTPHLTELLIAEAQLRSGCSYEDLRLPKESYWADLVRLLALHRARKQSASEEVEVIVEDIVDTTMQSFVRSSEM